MAKLKATSLLVLMFVLGVVSGIAWQTHASNVRTHHWKHVEHRIARLKKELQLNSWQEQAMRDILQDARERAIDIRDAVELDMAEIHKDSVNAIHQLLTPEQQKRFEKIRASHQPKRPKSRLAAPPPAEEEMGAG